MHRSKQNKSLNLLILLIILLVLLSVARGEIVNLMVSATPLSWDSDAAMPDILSASRTAAQSSGADQVSSRHPRH
jgi:flagellar basal body-associated protein FliL